MGDLTNKQIDQTYDGLIKTSDEQPIDGTLKNLQDGVGNDLPMQVSTTGVNFTGTVTGIPAGTDTTYDLDSAQSGADVDVRLTGSDATVDTVKLVAGTNVTLTDNGSNQITIDAAGGGGAGVDSVNTLTGALTLAAGTGISIADNGTDTITITNTGGGGGNPGLVAGTGTDSMKSADFLTTSPATASGPTSVAIGNNSFAGGEYDIALGDRVSLSASSGGENAGLGTNQTVSGFTNITLGGNINLDATENCFVAGTNTFIGGNSVGVISIGSSNSYGTACEASAIFGDFITLPDGTRNYYSFGADSPVGPNDPSNSVVIGTGSTVSGANQIAIGSNIAATRSNFLTTNELELKTVGGGIIMASPNGTLYKLTVSDAGALVITPV